MHGALAFHVFFLESLVVSLQLFHGMAQAFVVRVRFHVMADAFHGPVQATHVLTSIASLQTLLGMTQAFVPRIFLQSLFDALDGLFAGLLLFPRLGLLLGLGGGFVGRPRKDSAG